MAPTATLAQKSLPPGGSKTTESGATLTKSGGTEFAAQNNGDSRELQERGSTPHGRRLVPVVTEPDTRAAIQ